MNNITVINGCPIRPIKPKSSFANKASGKYDRELKHYKIQQKAYLEYILSHSLELDNISKDIIQAMREHYNNAYKKNGTVYINDLMALGDFLYKNNLGQVKCWLGPENQYFIHLKKEVRKYLPEYEPPRGWKHADGWYGDPMKLDD